MRQFQEARKSEQIVNSSMEGLGQHKKSLDEPVHGISTQLMAERQNNLG